MDGAGSPRVVAPAHPRRPVDDLPKLPSEPAAAQADDARSRRQIGHDIHHELGTIMLLARLLQEGEDVGPDSRRRASLIIGETRWLEQLVRAYESVNESTELRPVGHVQPIAVHEVVIEVTDAIRMATLTRVHVTAQPVYGRVSRLALWRALRNLLDNAVRAAGPGGTVDVRLSTAHGAIIMEVDDDGPGFGDSAPGRSSLGLNIVQDFVASAGGHMEIHRGIRGGCCVRLDIPELVSLDDTILEPRRSV